MFDYEYYYDQYRRVPKTSASAHKDLLDYQSAVSLSGYNVWHGSIKRPVTTTYIDGSTLLGPHECPYHMKGLFPKGKGRRKPSLQCEKKIVNRYSTFNHYINFIIFYRILVIFLCH
jgi:hypothetical protein